MLGLGALRPSRRCYLIWFERIPHKETWRWRVGMIEPREAMRDIGVDTVGPLDDHRRAELRGRCVARA
jgi:hypothetical protein